MMNERHILPPVFEIKFSQYEEGGVKRVRVTHDGIRLGDDLDDNSRQEDGYRFHDCAHFIHLTHTGHSHVIDHLLLGPQAPKKTVREFPRETQESFEEAWPLMAHNLRGKKNWVQNDRPKPGFLNILTAMAENAHFDAPPTKKTMGDIVCEFYKAMDFLRTNNGGSMICDTVNKTIQYKGPDG